MKLFTLCLALLKFGVYFQVNCDEMQEPEDGLGEFDSTQSVMIESPVINITLAPYTCALIMTNSNISCTCTILSDRFIVTAGHCVTLINPKPNPMGMQYSSEEITAVVGVNYLFEETKKLNVSGVKLHENYTSFHSWDVALILLGEKLELTETVKEIEIADESPRAGTALFVSGYGDDLPWFQTAGKSDRKLRGDNFVIADQELCKKSWIDYGDFEITEGHFCMDTAQQVTPAPDPCTGDSGGPAVTIEINKKLIGVFSYSAIDRCGDPKSLPAVYTNLVFYKDWINSSMHELTTAANQPAPEQSTNICTRIYDFFVKIYRYLFNRRPN